jgi:hypothetical protein
MTDWVTGSGERISFEKIVDIILEHRENFSRGSKICRIWT